MFSDLELFHWAENPSLETPESLVQVGCALTPAMCVDKCHDSGLCSDLTNFI